jgi:hypothetical protein
LPLKNIAQKYNRTAGDIRMDDNSFHLRMQWLTGPVFACDMRQFTLPASPCGGVTAFPGFLVAYAEDLPIG